MKWYVDETMWINSAAMEEFQQNHYILLNLAIGGPSTPFTQYQTVSDSFSSATMYVDYVRIYQGTDSNFVINKKKKLYNSTLIELLREVLYEKKTKTNHRRIVSNSNAVCDNNGSARKTSRRSRNNGKR